MARDKTRERKLPEPYRSAVVAYANVPSPRYVRWESVYETAERLAAGGGVLPDGYTAKEFFEALHRGVEERKVARKRLLAAERTERAEARRLSAGVELDLYERPARFYRGKNVWLFHGTTTKFLRSLHKHGLTGELRRTDPRGSLTKSVYLTALPGDEPCGAYRDAKVAAYVHGGEPLVVRVLVPFDALDVDPDDRDISCGRFQFIASALPLSAVYRLDGRPFASR